MPPRRTTAGDKSHLIRILAPAGVIAEDAVTVEEHVPAAIVATPLEFQSPERFAAGGLTLQVAYRVVTGYRTDLRPDFAIEEECCTERRLQILAIVPSDIRDSVEMRCVSNG